MKQKQTEQTAQTPQPTDQPLPPVYSRPVSLFLLAILVIFLSEIVVMLLLDQLPEFSPLVEASVDAALLSLIIVPSLYLFVYRPLRLNINRRIQTELAQQQMLEVDQLKSQIISTAAHEFGTPLTAVIGYTELLLERPEIAETERSEYLQTIYDKAMVLGRLTGDLLDLSRIDSGQVVRVEKREQSLLPIIENVVHYFQYSAPERTFETALPEVLAPFAFDAVRISQVLENLIGNALKYSPDGSPVRVEVEAIDDEVAIMVVDNGIGMTREQRERIFEKFYRADHSDTSTDGLGLGMTIVKEIVDGHGGRIRIDSIHGQGTSVTVTLPRS